MQVELTRNELVKLTTIMAYWHNDHGDDEDASKLYDKLGELLGHAPGDMVIPTEGPDAADLWRE